MTYLKEQSAVTWFLVGLAALGLVMAIVVARSTSAGANTEPVIESQALSVLAPDSEAVRAALPEDAKTWLASLESGAFGDHAGSVTGIGTAHTATNGDFTLVAIGASVCLHQDAGVEAADISGCTDMSHVEKGDAFLVKPGCTEHEVVGFMPDGISSLSVSPADSAVGGQIPVMSNVYAADLPPVKTVLTGETEAGVQIVVELPLDTTPTNCL